MLLAQLSTMLCGMSNLTYNDPYPVYSTVDPHALLTTPLKNEYRSYATNEQGWNLQFSISPYRQSAERGNDIDGNRVELGDLHGRWDMLALFYDPTAKTVLTNALNLNTSNPCYAVVTDPVPTSTIINPIFPDSREQFGYFSVPLVYRKQGVRFQADLLLSCDVGLRIQSGVASMRQTAVFNDLTCTATGFECPVPDSSAVCRPESFSCDCKTFVIEGIMRQKDTIAKTLGMNICDFNKTAMEDIRLSLFWRHVFPINQDDIGWPFILMTPFLMLNVSMPTANDYQPNKLFALSSGNNGHRGLGFTGGISFDFVETVELVVEAGMMHYFCNDFCNFPVPTHKLQSGMFPRLADVTVSPGDTWNFAMTLNAYHFLDKLSFWAQYVLVSHRQDQFNVQRVYPLASGDPIKPQDVLTKKLTCESSWDVHLANLSFTYDISPSMALGFLWQVPLNRRNAYRSSTIMGSFVVSF